MLEQYLMHPAHLTRNRKETSPQLRYIQDEVSKSAASDAGLRGASATGEPAPPKPDQGLAPSFFRATGRRQRGGSCAHTRQA